MKSTSRILTTHTGSLPRPSSLTDRDDRQAVRAVFQDVKLPEGKVIIPGVVDSTTNFVEHPELVAQRLIRYADLVGKPNVIAGSDCGFATSADDDNIDPKIVWAKLTAMAEGARLASERLWGHVST